MRKNLTPYELFVRDNAGGPAFRRPSQHCKTVICLQNTAGELDRITVNDDDASHTAITEATVQLILRAGSLDADPLPRMSGHAQPFAAWARADPAVL